jgi:hypothetical protein
MAFKLIFSGALAVMLTACGSSGGSDTEQKTTTTPVVISPPISVATYTGQFLDSAVSGLNYKTTTQSGQTNELGEFTFQMDEMITFSIGSIELPNTVARLYLTPLEIYQTTNINQVEVVNLLRLLQSLDLDGDASNGIEITEVVHQLATDLTIDFSANDFELQVSELIEQSGSANQEIISPEAAIAHFQQTLDEINNSDMTSCPKTHEKIGHSGFFNTFAHNVSGKATIIDDCTIEISEFSYDGGGPDVFFYGAIDHQYDGNDAFSIGTKIDGQVYNDAQLTIQLPQGKSLDDLTGISVWCIDFAANFGQMEFTL